MKLSVFFLVLFPLFLTAQSGYNQWLSTQGTEMHLLGDYKEKKVYGSSTGERSDLQLVQIQRYKDGRLKEDLVYKAYPKLIYNMVINYEEDNTATGINLVDSSKVTYAFTDAQKIRYYVVNRQNATHVIYTYDEEDLLIRCKDCLAPFGNHDWCAYYQYAYNEKKQLIKVSSYNLKKGAEVTTKVLFATDSLIYDNNQLTTRWTLNPAGNATQKATYIYNKKKLLVEEKSTQLPPYVNIRSYTKSYEYHCNKVVKKKTEAYYTDNRLDGKQIAIYNKKGRKTKQESYRGDDQRTNLYEMKYKMK